ncbi:hypothetical protein ACTMTI_51615 [Nonomuraea sp. H19]|uniref:hypothetical protein n=1 Tax=Nonomuraea sp. H19 TaxID=3452206 RepID=UPI003F8BB304
MRLHTEFIAYLEEHREQADIVLRALARDLAADEVLQWSPELRAPLGVVPILLDGADHSALVAAGLLAGSLLPRLPGLLFGDLEAAMDAFAVPDAMRPFIRAEVPREITVARTDFMLGLDGWRFIEINNGASVGGLLVGDYDRRVRARPFLTDFLDRRRLGNTSPARVLAAEVLSRCDDLPIDGRPTVAIVDWAGHMDEFPLEYPQLAAQYRAGGLDTVVCAQTQLRHEHGRLWYEGRPVHAVHREFLLEDLTTEEVTSAYQILAAAEAGDVVLISGFRHEWLSHKGSFAMLHEAAARGVLSERERELVEQYVPTTWMLNESGTGLRHATLSPDGPFPLAPESLVAKPCLGSLGQGVLIGALCQGDDFWSGVRDHAGKTPYVLQQLVYPKTAPFAWLEEARLTFDAVQILPGLFTVAGRPAGWWSRLMRGEKPAITNAAYGAARGSIWSEATR